MENASKALLIAGSVLLSLLIIGVLVFAYNELSDLQQTRADADDNTKLSSYMEDFEKFNRTLYGSEILSLANLQEDYNRTLQRYTQTGPNEYDGYKEIEINITISRSIAGSTFFQAGTYTLENIEQQKDNLEYAISQYEKTSSRYNNRSVKYYSQRTYREIANDFDVEVSSDAQPYEIIDALNEKSITKNLLLDIQEYDTLNSIYTEFREGKRFECTNIEYDDNNGRIILMDYNEI